MYAVVYIHHVVNAFSRSTQKKAISRLAQIFLIFFPTNFHFNGKTMEYKFKWISQSNVTVLCYYQSALYATHHYAMLWYHLSSFFVNLLVSHFTFLLRDKFTENEIDTGSRKLLSNQAKPKKSLSHKSERKIIFLSSSVPIKIKLKLRK